LFKAGNYHLTREELNRKIATVKPKEKTQ